MTYELTVKPGAEDDALEATLWYNEQKAGLGDEFLQTLEAEFDRIQRGPFIYSVRYRKTRIAFIERFPFGIHFSVEKERINVLAILHTSGNPKIWDERETSSPH